ncbi:winged helix-turn-helix domain-containing protein [Stenotrophomonas indicatrix]|uniref:winged helix-turn-helix domain-containing protein n=1 Tax=Stenotrophomonas indicatrix TaxID=2045451 RepID=UPI00215A5518|nr:winged helix-turn-helix domain-containing protein [Stenotrophomonas indicatrix]MCR8713107.1 winged helix-turn-helix domain-containing protein [Stenotrophomonas indicatrix]
MEYVTGSRQDSIFADPHPTGAPQEVWQFGSLVISGSQRRVELSGCPVRLGPRSFDLLFLLVTHAGEFITNREILSSVWNGVVVEEASVRVHISLIRKALGEPASSDGCGEWISNVPLRGYRFNGLLTTKRVHDCAVNDEVASSLVALPAGMSPLIGRERVIQSVLSQLATHRLVTIAGAGGIGKTSVALCCADRWRERSKSLVAFADLSSLVSPDHVSGAIARALGAPPAPDDPLAFIAQALCGKKMLLVIDNCEHVIHTLAGVLSYLLQSLSGLTLLATSRENLELPGELVFRLPGLELPDAATTTYQQLVSYPAVELLVARARAAGAQEFCDKDVDALVEVSQKLEGVPLAIELVAARLGTLPIRNLASRLSSHASLLSLRSRGANSRHQSLAAALDWSMALLSAHEVQLLRTAATFRGTFDLEDALAICPDNIDPDESLDAMSSLVNKSLIMFSPRSHFAPYRLLDTTRAYASASAFEAGELPQLLHRHAQHMVNIMLAARSELPLLSEISWEERYLHRIDDVRYALQNTSTSPSTIGIAAALLEASSPVWFNASLLAEYRDGIAATLSAMERENCDSAQQRASLATMLLVATLQTDELNPDLDALYEKAIDAVSATGSRVLELQTRWARCTYEMFRGSYASALEHADELMIRVQEWSEPAALNLSHRTSAMANHFMGRFERSRRHSMASLDVADMAMGTPATMVGVAPRIAASALLCRTQWIQGATRVALETASSAVKSAFDSKHSLSLCAALFGACPVALWSGELDLASQWVALMRHEAKRRGLGGWYRFAEWFQHGLDLQLSGGRVHESCISELVSGFDLPKQEMLATFSIAWSPPSLWNRAAAGESLWCAAEVLRGQAAWHREEGDLMVAEQCLRRGLALAHAQGSHGWARRLAYDLALDLNSAGRRPEALRCLEQVLAMRQAGGEMDRMLVRLSQLHQQIQAHPI